MRKTVYALLAMCILFVGCKPDVEFSVKPCTVKGKAIYENYEDPTDIFVGIEKSDGLITASVRSIMSDPSRSLQSNTDRSVLSYGDVQADGSYIFEDLTPGTYSIYAESNISNNKVVKRNVIVASNKVTTVDDFVLTATGSISGRVTLDGNEIGNYGFLVFV